MNKLIDVDGEKYNTFAFICKQKKVTIKSQLDKFLIDFIKKNKELLPKQGKD